MNVITDFDAHLESSLLWLAPEVLAQVRKIRIFFYFYIARRVELKSVIFIMDMRLVKRIL